jgi:hypothetical protein
LFADTAHLSKGVQTTMSIQFRDLADRAAADGTVSADEILGLRRAGWGDGQITPDEAEALFAINDAAAAPSVEWSDFFVEALGEYIINRIEPKGYVSPVQADWPIARIDKDGRLQSLTELELLVRLSERALSVPQNLRDYALAQIEAAVLSGEGPTRSGGTLAKGCVTAAEALLMRRVIFASGSERPGGVSRSEAEALYRIKDAALGGDNAPEWQTLFVQGVANYIAGFTAYEPLSRERAAELESFVADTRSSVGGFLGWVARASLRDNFFETAADAFDGEPEGPDRAAQADEARRVDLEEQAWLTAKIDADREVDAYEAALLAFIAEESGFKP